MMRVRIEMVGDDDPVEAVIYCRKVTPEVEDAVRQLSLGQRPGQQPTFYKGEEQYYLTLSEILFFETDEDKVFAHTEKDSYETKQRLYELDSILPKYFVRISRSTIANTLHIFSIQRGIARAGLVSFRGSYKEVYVSRMYNNILKEKMEERNLYEKT
jgi:DNA-binding LytR/AlgR family response regulator